MERDTEKRLQSAESVKEKLHVAFDVWVISPVSQAIKSKSGRDIITNCETYAPDAVKDMYDRIEKHILRIFKPGVENSQAAEDIAKTLRFATFGFKHSTTNIKYLKRQVSAMIEVAVAATEAGR